MSANNFYFARKIGDKWYGWDEMAEASMMDTSGRVLNIKSADAEADTIEELEHKLDERGLGYAEYGLTTSPYLPKDGTPIEVVQ